MMGTPMRRLIPKILSPLSRSPTKNSVNNKSRICVSTKYLSVEDTLLKKFHKDEFQIKITDYTDKLVINTPNKRQLMNSGVPSNSNLEILGKGSFGTVISGVYKSNLFRVDKRPEGIITLDCRVAAKIMKVRNNNVKDRNALNFNHRNVIKVIDVIHSTNCNYAIVLMEYYNLSRHLQSVIDDRTVDLSLKKIVQYSLDICEGLRYCHDNKLLHLDVKPGNILLCENRVCKLCDFGNSATLGEIGAENVFGGTVIYTAPELLSGKIPTVKCDVYSLGIMLWQLRYRRVPYSNLDGLEVVKYKYRPSVSNEDRDEYFSVFSSCWSAEPNERPEILHIISKLKAMR